MVLLLQQLIRESAQQQVFEAGSETGGEHKTQGREDNGVAGPAAGDGTKQLRVELDLLFGGVGGGFVVGEGG